jgi:YVTN family beta-propeller protein
VRVFLAGRVAIETDGLATDEAQFPGRQGRLLFAYLVAAQDRSVPRDELAEALWGDAQPPTWDKALTILVSKLRGLFAEHGADRARVLTAAFGCYRLDLPDGCWVDIRAAADAARDADEATAAGDFDKAKAAALLTEALTRPAVLPGEDGAWIARLRQELADVRQRALEVLADACLGLGQEAEAAGWARLAIAHEPFREAGYRDLMLAHVAAGNRAEGLRVYEECRQLLSEELGAYPSPETVTLYRELLEPPASPAPIRAREPQAPQPEFSPAARSTGRRPFAIAVLVAVVVVGVITAVVVSRRTSGREAATLVAANSVVALDPDGSVAATVAVGARPVAMSSGAGSLWVANLDDQSVTRVDVSTRLVAHTVTVGEAPTALAATKSAVWVSDVRGQLSKIDPMYNRVTSTQDSAVPSSYNRAAAPLLAAAGSLWRVDPDGYLTRIDPDSGRHLGSVDVGNDPSAIATGAGSIWVANNADGTVTRIDPTTLVPSTFPVGHGPAGIAVDAAGVWVANAGDNTLVRIDPDTNVVTSTTTVGNGPTAVLASPSALWVANGRDGTVQRIDPRTAAVTKTIALGGTPDALTFAGNHVWVALAAAAPLPVAAGGTAHFTLQEDSVTLDPALPTPLGIAYATCANLVTYPDALAPDGARVVPEVADSVPTPTDGGRKYTFHIVSGFRFSPQSNEAVTAATFKATIERVIAMKSWTSTFSNIVGYAPYVNGTAREIAGIVADGSTLTITLSQPDGAFLSELAGGAACAVPRGTPVVAGGLNVIPSAGPYYVSSFTPRQQFVLKRNPSYHGDRPHHLDEIRVALGINSSLALDEIKAGTADYALDGLPPETAPALALQYGTGSAAAKAGHQQYFLSPSNGIRYLHMNTSRPLFADVRLRRAVSYAIDRAALAAQGQRFGILNPFSPGQATDAFLPPSTAGATDLHLYPLAGDLRRAKQIAGPVHATAIMYTADSPPWQQEAEVVRRDLRPLGIDVEIREFAFDDFLNRVGRRAEPFDLTVMGWGLITNDPSEALSVFDTDTIPAGNNLSFYENPLLDSQFAAAAELSGTDRYRAYRNVQIELQRDLVPAAPFATTVSRDFFSARIGCQLYQPILGMDFAALCLRK